MRRLVAGCLITGMVVLSSFTVVRGQADPIPVPTQVRTTPGVLTNMIGEVDVPWEILEYIQMKYEGHAVTKADKVRRGTSELYRLRVDRDDQITDYESIAVLFDMNWKLVGEEKYATPPPKPTPKPEENTVPETTNEQRIEQSNPLQADIEKPEEGGSGGDPTNEPDDESEEDQPDRQPDND